MENKSKKRNPTVFTKIAKLFGKKEHYVKHILKIGTVNPLYFERIVSGRISPFLAYHACLEEEKKRRGEIPLDEVPTPSEPIYIGNGDDFELPDDETTDEVAPDNSENKVSREEVIENLNVTVDAALPENSSAEESENIASIESPENKGGKIIRCQCPKCGEQLDVKITNQ